MTDVSEKLAEAIRRVLDLVPKSDSLRESIEYVLESFEYPNRPEPGLTNQDWSWDIDQRFMEISLELTSSPEEPEEEEDRRIPTEFECCLTQSDALRLIAEMQNDLPDEVVYIRLRGRSRFQVEWITGNPPEQQVESSKLYSTEHGFEGKFKPHALINQCVQEVLDNASECCETPCHYCGD